MKTLKFTSLALLIMALVSFTGTPISYSSSNDDNHLSANDSIYSPPGYMNKEIQQARSLTDKYLANKDKADNKTEATQREVSQKVQTQAVEKPKPVLKQKQSSKNAQTSPAGTITLTADQKKQVIANLAKLIQTRIGAVIGQSPRYDANLDINGSGSLSIIDATYVSRVTTLSDSQFSTVFTKIMAGTKDRIGLTSGDSKYISAFDLNNDGAITTSDYNAMRTAIGSGRANLPASPFQQLTSSSDTKVTSPYSTTALNYDTLAAGSSVYTSNSNFSKSNTDKLSVAFKSLLKNSINDSSALALAEGQREAGDSLKHNALAVPAINKEGMSVQEMDVALKLANILRNPTDDQKAIIDAIKALLGQTEKVMEEGANKAKSEEMEKAQNDLLQAVANILLAQAVPDLLNKGDVSNIKAMFSELDTQRNKIMLEYAQSTKPYYENMIKDMAKNMAMLQSKNLLNPNMSKDELSKLPPSELDKILDKIRNMKDKSFEEKYLLQQEAKYRQDYLDPNNKKLESDMKGMLKNFTGRINDVLKSSEKK